MPYTVTPNDSQVTRYKRLLVSDWSLDTIAAAIDLLAELLPFIDVETELPGPSTSLVDELPVPGMASDYVRDYIEQLNEERAQKAMGQSVPGSRPGYSLLVEQVLTYLLVGERTSLLAADWPPLRDPSGFLHDVQSLLVQVTILDLLPEMPRDSLETLELVRGLYGHIVAAWTDAPAQREHLLALLYEHLGAHERATQAKLNVFRLTPPNAHEYLTNAQIYWGALMEQGDFERARRFLLSVYRSAEHEHLAELEEMLVDTFAVALPRAKGSDRSRSSV